MLLEEQEEYPGSMRGAGAWMSVVALFIVEKDSSQGRRGLCKLWQVFAALRGAACAAPGQRAHP